MDRAVVTVRMGRELHAHLHEYSHQKRLSVEGAIRLMIVDRLESERRLSEASSDPVECEPERYQADEYPYELFRF